MKNKKGESLVVFLLLLTFLFLLLFLVTDVAAVDECKGKITAMDWIVDENRKLIINLEIKNTGNEKCNYRVYLYDDKHREIGEAPSPVSRFIPIAGGAKVHVPLLPGKSFPLTLTSDPRIVGKYFTLELWHVGLTVSSVIERGHTKLTLMDYSEKINILFECKATCHGKEIKEKSYISKDECWNLLGQKCGKGADCSKKKTFEGCKNCCENDCSKAGNVDPTYETDFQDGCIRGCGRTCDIYYEAITVENPNSKNTRIIDPGGYTQTIIINSKNCEKISGDFDNYKVTDLPQCRYFQYQLLGGFELVFPERQILEKEAEEEKKRKEEATGPCKITSAIWGVTNALRGDQVPMIYKTKGNCLGTTPEFLICEDDVTPLSDMFGRDCRSWLSPDDFVEWVKGTKVWTVKLTDENDKKIPEGWWDDFSSLPYEFYFRVFLKKNGKDISNAYSDQLIVGNCEDDALVLCPTGKKGDQAIYGVTNATRYVEIAELNLSHGETEHWLIDRNKYVGFDIKTCNNPDKKENYEKYTYADDRKYKKFVKDNFEKEPFFKKYSQMYGENYTSYLYCYKTALKDTKGCKEVMNYGWYSMTDFFPIPQVNQIYPNYIKGVKIWNYYQDVDDALSEDALTGKEHEKGNVIKNSWTKVFTISPKLEDKKNNYNWTAVGNGTVYVGSGSERYDACKFSCDAKGKNDAFEGCNSFREDTPKKYGGIGTDECSVESSKGCYIQHREKNKDDCTKGSSYCGDSIDDTDCNKVCRVEAYYSDEGVTAITTFKIPNVKIKNNEQPTVEEISGNVKVIKHPAFNITERGNLEFSIEDVKFSSSGDTYTLKRTYKPVDNKRKFVVDSDIVFNYDLLDLKNVNDLNVEVKHKYKTKILKEKYYVTCDEKCCEGKGDDCKKLYTVTDCKKPLISIPEEIPEEKVVKDSIRIPKVSHSNITDTTKVSITGSIDKVVNEFNEIDIHGFMNVTLDPNILGSFLMEAKDAGISYRALYYPVVHELSKKKSSPPSSGTGIENHHYAGRYGYEDKEFNFNEQCRKICPGKPQCECPIDKPFQPMCFDLESEEPSRSERKDCACLPSGCYPDPCMSDRTFHEEEGSRIVNGDFEQDLNKGKFWVIESGEASRELGGYPGYMLKLNGKVYQNISPVMHSQPYNELCLEYGSESADEFKIILTEGGERNEHTICSGNDCSTIIGWNKKCFPVTSAISRVELISKGEVFIDNVNLGRYYDFVNIRTANVSQMMYRGSEELPWDSTGLFKTEGVFPDKNAYLFTFTVQKRVFTHPKTADFLIYTLSDQDILNTTMAINTFFRNETYHLFPARREENLYINVTFRNASKIHMEYLPKSLRISPDTRVTIKLNLSFFETKEPIPYEKIYLDFLGEDIWKLKPEHLEKEEIDGKIRAYVKTLNNGMATFSFKPKRTTTINAEFKGNKRASPSKASLDIPILSLRSPLLSMEVLILLIIFYLSVFAYRFFKPRRADLYHLWQEFIGRRL